MQIVSAIQTLARHDRQGRHVFTRRDLAMLFRRDSPDALAAGLRRLVNSGVLARAARGVYVFALSAHLGEDTLEFIARAMREGEYSYISLESALSEYGAISQVPIGRITVMTTGRKGEYKTPFGVIEFTHTGRPVEQFIPRIFDRGRPLRIADKHLAWRDLKRVGRNTDLVDQEALHED